MGNNNLKEENQLNDFLLKKILGEEYTLENPDGYNFGKNEIIIAKNGSVETKNKFELIDICEQIMINEYHLIVNTYNDKLNGFECGISSFYGDKEVVITGKDRYDATLKAFKIVLNIL